jgi:sec-independent protein translocase protein TatA
MFDPSAPHIIILLVVILLLFGSKRLPGAAKSMGQAMRNFKGEMKQMHDEPEDSPQATAQSTLPPAAIQQPVAPAAAQPAAADVTQTQLSDLQRQLAELQAQQRQNVPAGGAAPDSQSTQQPF